jgi:UV DNA damage endonuclease
MCQEFIRFGYCCLNTQLRKNNIFTSRTCRLETIKKKGIEYVYELINNNLRDLKSIIEWNHCNDIHVFRMSSEMFPFATHSEYNNIYNMEQFKVQLKEIGDLAKSLNQRLTFHPGQYTLLTSLKESVVLKSIEELNFHAEIMDIMGLPQDSVMVIHGGSKEGGKIAAMERFKINFKRLGKSAQDRLVLENCEMCYTVADLLPTCKELSIPMVFDAHHYNLNKGEGDLSFLLKEILDIWMIRKITPKFHLSECRPGVVETDSITKRRAHSDYITQVPELFNLIKKEWLYNGRLDLMLEAKMKEDCLLRLRETIRESIQQQNTQKIENQIKNKV